MSAEKSVHACQIPQKLTELLVKAATKKGDVVLVLFGGSGAELEVCKNLGRHFISAEIDERYYKIIQDRLQSGRVPEEHRLLTKIKAGRVVKRAPTPLMDQTEIPFRFK